jgi:transposase InsO family protein
LTLEALQVALGWRDPRAGLLHHSNRGWKYAGKDYRKVPNLTFATHADFR